MTGYHRLAWKQLSLANEEIERLIDPAGEIDFEALNGAGLDRAFELLTWARDNLCRGEVAREHLE